MKTPAKLRKSAPIILVFIILVGLILTLNQYFGILENADFGGVKLVENFFTILFSVTIIATIVLVILENGRPTKTIAWILILILVPLIGFLLYLYFGRNYRKNKIFSRKGLSDLSRIEELSQNQIKELGNESLLENPYIKAKGGIMRLLLNNNKALLTENNRVAVLNNGTETFETILRDLKNANHHIHLEYYILEDDNIGHEIKRILIDRAKNGVKVRIIYDEVGSWGLSKRYLKELRKHGIEPYAFMPVRFPFFANKVNYRNHRKVIVIDGLIGFVGGINIADKYIHGDPDLGFWRDTHLKLEGDAVHSLQAVFMTDWYFVSNQVISVDKCFPEHHVTSKKLVQIATCGPDSDWASIMQAYFMAITTAKNYIYISTPYFMPNGSILTALKTAALSGVKVVILLPGKTDFFLYTWTTNSYLEELLEAGIEVYIYKKGFTHSKLVMVDGLFSSVGTANMDVRSFDQNFEVNALIYDKEIAHELEVAFNEDLKNSQRVSWRQVKRKSVPIRIRESVARVFTPLL
ncbi:cardiolipin synthase [Fulvivirgaceae bacterium BMA12]|uniref:Cardiolipin synthase n=1 Tax=Agaribacillus aureus TaxID=3051825 RepID=A0ABT8L625_9BACT|nr:cardiolipin synthase [Fulvivirgaceae bacterium BMA12]